GEDLLELDDNEPAPEGVGVVLGLGRPVRRRDELALEAERERMTVLALDLPRPLARQRLQNTTRSEPLVVRQVVAEVDELPVEFGGGPVVRVEVVERRGCHGVL